MTLLCPPSHSSPGLHPNSLVVSAPEYQSLIKIIKGNSKQQPVKSWLSPFYAFWHWMTYYCAIRGEKRGHGATVMVRHVQNANSKQRMRWTDKYCSFPEIMSPSSTPNSLTPKKRRFIFIYMVDFSSALSWRQSQMMLGWAETLWGRKGRSSWRKRLEWSSHFGYRTSDAKWIFESKPDKARRLWREAV